MKRFLRTPSPAMVVACAALFVSLGGVSYAVATIGSERHRQRLDPQPRLQGRHAARPGGQAGRLRPQRRSRSRLSTPPSSSRCRPRSLADGVTRQAVISTTGATVRARGVASSAQTGTGPVPGHLRPRRAPVRLRRRRSATSRRPVRARARSPSPRLAATSTACAWSRATATARWPTARSTCWCRAELSALSSAPSASVAQQGGHQRRGHQQQHGWDQQQRHHQLDLRPGARGLLARVPGQGEAGVAGLGGERLAERRAVAARAVERRHQRPAPRAAARARPCRPVRAPAARPSATWRPTARHSAASGPWVRAPTAAQRLGERAA